MENFRSAIPGELLAILTETPELRRAYPVGGCVRDALLGLPIENWDIEVFGLSYEELANSLKRWGRGDLVGKSFGVLKLKATSGAIYDFSLARRDSKIRPGHKGFQISADPDLTLREAAARRDFTINALMFDLSNDAVLDFFGGQADLEKKILRHTTASFVEDPLRVLRGMQLAGRFGLRADPATIALSRQIKDAFTELPGERIRDEWCKWAGKSALPSAGLKFLEETEWIEHFPELNRLRSTPQDPEWHPEGGVFTHTCHCCDALARLTEWKEAPADKRMVWMFAVLTHDFGKAETTQTVLRDGQTRIVSPRHEEVGQEIAERFLGRISLPRHLVERILPLVANHMIHLQRPTERSVRRLARRLEPENIESLAVVITADHMGRPPLPAVVPEQVTALRALARELEVQAAAPAPILTGKGLLALGVPAGKEMGGILHHAYEAQLDGEFNGLSGAYEWLAGQSWVELPEVTRQALESFLSGEAKGTAEGPGARPGTPK